MRVLLDECLPRGFRRFLPEHNVRTVQELGWSGTTNGALLRRAIAEGFEAFLTVDRNLEFQQAVSAMAIGVVAVRAPSNDIDDLRPLAPQVLAALARLRSGQVIHVP